jgi:hypothetical protein
VGKKKRRPRASGQAGGNRRPSTNTRYDASASTVVDRYRDLRASLRHPVQAHLAGSFLHGLGILHSEGGGPDPAVLMHPARTPAEFAALVGEDLSCASIWQVPRDLSGTVTAACAASSPESTACFREAGLPRAGTPGDGHVPGTAGFAWLDSPAVIESGGAGITFRAFSWAVTESACALPLRGLRITGWHSLADTDDIWTRRKLSQVTSLLADRMGGKVPGLVINYTWTAPFNVEVRPGPSPALWLHTLFGMLSDGTAAAGQPQLRKTSAARYAAVNNGREPSVRVLRYRPRPPQDDSTRPGEPGTGTPVPRRPREYTCQWESARHHRHRTPYDVAAFGYHSADAGTPPGGNCLTCGGEIYPVRGSVKGPAGKPLKPRRPAAVNRP